MNIKNVHRCHACHSIPWKSLKIWVLMNFSHFELFFLPSLSLQCLSLLIRSFRTFRVKKKIENVNIALERQLKLNGSEKTQDDQGCSHLLNFICCQNCTKFLCKQHRNNFHARNANEMRYYAILLFILWIFMKIISSFYVLRSSAFIFTLSTPLTSARNEATARFHRKTNIWTNFIGDSVFARHKSFIRPNSIGW